MPTCVRSPTMEHDKSVFPTSRAGTRAQRHDRYYSAPAAFRNSVFFVRVRFAVDSHGACDAFMRYPHQTIHSGSRESRSIIRADAKWPVACGLITMDTGRLRPTDVYVQWRRTLYSHWADALPHNILVEDGCWVGGQRVTCCKS